MEHVRNCTDQSIQPPLTMGIVLEANIRPWSGPRWRRAPDQRKRQTSLLKPHCPFVQYTRLEVSDTYTAIAESSVDTQSTSLRGVEFFISTIMGTGVRLKWPFCPRSNGHGRRHSAGIPSRRKRESARVLGPPTGHPIFQLPPDNRR
jgi:hypothetical protein